MSSPTLTVCSPIGVSESGGSQIAILRGPPVLEKKSIVCGFYVKEAELLDTRDPDEGGMYRPTCMILILTAIALQTRCAELPNVPQPRRTI